MQIRSFREIWSDLIKTIVYLPGEGNLNFGANFDLVNFRSAGKVIHTLDSGKVNIEAILALDFFFSPEALKMMADEIRMKPSLKPVNLNSELNNKGMKDLMGDSCCCPDKRGDGSVRNIKKPSQRVRL